MVTVGHNKQQNKHGTKPNSCCATADILPATSASACLMWNIFSTVSSNMQTSLPALHAYDTVAPSYYSVLGADDNLIPEYRRCRDYSDTQREIGKPRHTTEARR